MIEIFVTFIETLAEWFRVGLRWIHNRIRKLFCKKNETCDFEEDETIDNDILEQDEQCDKPLRWKIWVTSYDITGNVIGRSVYPTDYAQKCSAVRRAKKVYGTDILIKWEVSQTNPWVTDSEAK